MRLIKIITFSTVFLAPAFLTAQPGLEWVRTYHGPANGGTAKYIKTDAAGNIYITGDNTGSGNYDLATIKYSPAGDSLWVRRYNNGGSNEHRATGLAVDKDGNTYITGYNVYPGEGVNWVIAKYSPSGAVLWQRQYNFTEDDRTIGIGIDDSGYVYTGGVYNDNGADGWGIIAVKYNPANGDTIWASRYNESPGSIEIPYAAEVDRSGNLYITGYTQSSAAVIQSVVLKYSRNGIMQWASLYRVPSVSGVVEGHAIKTDKNGNVYTAGECYNGQGTFVDFLIMKHSPSGDTLWVRRYSNSSSIDAASDLAVDDSGHVYVTGKSFTGGGGSNNYDYMTVKFSPAGNFMWKKLYDGTAGLTQDEAESIALDKAGNCYITGGSSVSRFFYSGEFATVKYDKNGNELWAVRNASGDFGGTALALDTLNNVYVAGSITASYALLKYSQMITGITDPPEVPLSYSLSQNYPNPFNPETHIAFDIPRSGFVTLRVYDITGREAAALVNENRQAGRYIVSWNAVNFASGVYFYKIEAGDFIQTKRMLLVK
jgi:hypothetical protein